MTSQTASAAQHLLISTSAENEDARCKYPSKPCSNKRAVKQDGQLHRFCEYHRVKANFNQRRLERRRREDQRMQQEYEEKERQRIAAGQPAMATTKGGVTIPVRGVPRTTSVDLTEDDVKTLGEFISSFDLNDLPEIDDNTSESIPDEDFNILLEALSSNR